MRVRVLGSAAGGGFPQWNCGCDSCRGVRAGTVRAARRGEVCLAVSGDGERWLLIGAPPDVRAHIEAFPALHPRAARDTPIAGVLLPNGDLDACLGLYTLRERQPLTIHASSVVRRGFTEGVSLYRTLQRFPGQVSWATLTPGRAASLPGGLVVEPVAAPGKPPLHLVGLSPPDAGDNLGFVIHAERGGFTIAYFPSVAPGSPAALAPVLAALRRADVVVFDGTFWSDDELGPLADGLTAASMAHWPLGGASGSLATLAALPARTRRVTHINNTNPILRDDSPERAALARAGVHPAHDGEELAP